MPSRTRSSYVSKARRALCICVAVLLTGACADEQAGDDDAGGVVIDDTTTLTWQDERPPELIVAVEPAPTYPSEPGLTPVGSTVKLGPSGPAPTFRLQFDVGDAPAEDAVPVVGFTDGATWSYIEPVWDADAGTVTVEADHFSWWSVFWVRASELIGDTLLNALGVIDQSALTCDSTLPDGWSIRIEGSAGGDLSMCAELTGDTLTIDLKNQRRASFIVSLPDGWTGTLDQLAPLADTISSWLFNSFGRSALVIPGGAVGRITVPNVVGNGNTVRLTIDQDMFAWAVDTMITAGVVYLGGSKFVRTATDPRSLLTYLGASDGVRGLLDCIGKTREFADALAQSPSVDVLEAFLPAALECARQFAEEGVAGALNLATGAVVGVVVSTWSLLEMTIDLVSGNSNRTLVITSGPLLETSCTSTLLDGTPAQIRLGDGVSCEEAQRIAAEYRQAPLQGSAAAAPDLSDGWGCSTASAGEAATQDFITGCTNDDGRRFELL